ncbi:MAG: hypothetical protein GWO00_23675, partial [Gemmatimonadetes bacterium]|nr:hypothetical protein [Gemmatimonadota bacterium]NIT90084.1 hypothetical protein [Gemmatimonadota bacterium]NIU33896.1 hypothetical protein [Gemmatimonadota bacterium]NIV64230.1 hypothetical protein [Gemmatimonadota bacterium]NIW66974.1 hypothetical protein [Gemmatimonadota bacterium]
SPWTTLRRLTRGDVETTAMAIPEGFTLAQMAPRIAEITGLEEPGVRDSLASESLADSLGVPGPTLEGYLFPDTYFFASGV